MRFLPTIKLEDSTTTTSMAVISTMATTGNSHMIIDHPKRKCSYDITESAIIIPKLHWQMHSIAVDKNRKAEKELDSYVIHVKDIKRFKSF